MPPAGASVRTARIGHTRLREVIKHLLGGAGNGRHQLQILKEFDPCCFAGLRAHLEKILLRDARLSAAATWPTTLGHHEALQCLRGESTNCLAFRNVPRTLHPGDDYDRRK
jgi:hypothetical protein